MLKMRMQLWRGFHLIGEGAFTLDTDKIDVNEVTEENQKRQQALTVAKWMLATEQAINAAGPLRCHLELLEKWPQERTL